MPPPPAELFASRVLLGPALRVQPDRRLVELVRDGYDAAFEEIVRRYRRPLERFAASIVDGRAEDVTQDAFSKALQSLRGSDSEIDLRPWLYRIVRNTALNDLRDRAPAAEQLAESLPGGPSAAAAAERREELRDLTKRLRALPEPQRAAIVMRELGGMGHEEIAAALGVSGGAARQAIHRARTALREGLGLLVPAPLVRALLEGGAALKAGVATVLVAGSLGTGIAFEHHRGAGDAVLPAPAVAAEPEAAVTAMPRAPSAGTGPARARGRRRGAGGDGENVTAAADRGTSLPAVGGEHGGGSADGGRSGSSSGPPSGAAPAVSHGGGQAGEAGDATGEQRQGATEEELADDGAPESGADEGLSGDSGGDGESSDGGGGTSGGDQQEAPTTAEPEPDPAPESSEEADATGGDGSLGSVSGDP